MTRRSSWPHSQSSGGVGGDAGVQICKRELCCTSTGGGELHIPVPQWVEWSEIKERKFLLKEECG